MSLDFEIAQHLDLESDSKLKLVADEDGSHHYEIVGFDSFKEQVQNALDFLRDRRLEEDDRKMLAKVRANVNKYTKALNDLIKAETSGLFSVIDSQKKEINVLLGSITSELKSKIDTMDQEARLEKQGIYDAELKRRQEYQPELSSIDAFDIIDAAWLNRTFDSRKALVELDERLDKVKKLIDSSHCLSTDASEICVVLQLHDWSELDAIEYLEQKYAPAEEVLEDVVEQSETVDVEEIQKEIIRLEINSKDFDRLFEVLNQAGLDFKLV